MLTLPAYVRLHTATGGSVDPRPWVADLVFFHVTIQGSPQLADFRDLSAAHRGVFQRLDPFDGQAHGYMALAHWIGDQGLALRFMALGSLLGAFDLLTPRQMFSAAVDDGFVQTMAGKGLIAIRASRDAVV